MFCFNGDVRPHPLAAAAWALLAVAAVGCQSAHFLESPDGWPAEWAGRKVYHTAHAVIYARHDAAAQSADELARRVWEDFEKRTGARASKGLLLVTDVDDGPVIPDYRTYCDLSARHGSAAEGRVLSEEALDRRYRGILAALEEQGVDPEMELLMTPVALSSADVSDVLSLPLPPQEPPAWAVALSTRPVIERANQANMQRELKRRKIGPLVQVPLAPIILFEERVRNVKALVARQVALFRAQARQQPEWTVAQQERYTQEYMDRRLGESLTPVLTLLRDAVEVVTEPLKTPRKATEGTAAPGT